MVLLIFLRLGVILFMFGLFGVVLFIFARVGVIMFIFGLFGAVLILAFGKGKGPKWTFNLNVVVHFWAF